MMPPKPIVEIILCWSWLCWVFFVMLSHAEVDFGSDTIFQGQVQLRDWHVLSSANKTFTLKFFSLGSLNGRYLGIFRSGNFYAQVRTEFYLLNESKPAWIANRNNPVNDHSGALMIDGTNGMLQINHTGGKIILPASSPTGHWNINTCATLREDGNLVLRQVYPNGSISPMVLWQSFDYPTDILLPGMKLGINLKTEYQWSLTSWISHQSPSSGSFTLGVNRNSSDGQLIIWFQQKVFWTSELWLKYPSGSGNLVPDTDSSIVFKYISNENENYFKYSQTTNDGTYTAIYLTPNGMVQVIPGTDEIVSCDLASFFRQSDSGCANNSFPECMNVDNSFGYYQGYYRSNYSFYPPSTKEDYNNNSIMDCQAKCVQNCSCYGYASLHENGTGCEYYSGSDAKYLLGLVTFGAAERIVYLRSTTATANKRQWLWLITTVGGTLFMLISIPCILRKCRGKDTWKEDENSMLHELVVTNTSREHVMMVHETLKEIDEKKMIQVNLFRFETIEMATNKFSPENKLGEGGFGQVHKGKLLDGQEIAVKKLSRSSSQGMVEFENEIQLIVKLQHNNLVRLLGCCIHGEDMMLVYEYMPNKSLDFFIFDPTKRELLKWTHCMNIIEGIAQGLLYLHKHSRLRVIHRDLKASNILLDENMTPKISDFGMARIFGMHDSEANTKRIVGTHGYMSPEYAINGIVSTKADVFSFGVLLLEIVSGKRNRSSYHKERPLNLIGLAWELLIQGRALDLVDSEMDVSNHLNEVNRCINIGLLCVQDSAADRPSMKDVILMLENELLQLPTPKQPAFFIETNTVDRDIEESQEENNCTNKLSTSIMEPR